MFILKEDGLSLLNYLRRIVKERRNDKFLFFIDPHGYTGMHRDLIKDLMSQKNAEVILFLPVNYIYRFKNMKNKKNEALENFLRSFFTDDEMKQLQNMDEMEFIKILSEKMKFNDQTYVSFYYIEKDKMHNKYALFFVTSNLKGLEKFVYAKWKNDPLYGAGYRHKKTKESQYKQLSLFSVKSKEELEKEKMMEYYKNRIREFIKEKEPNNIELLIFVLEKLSLSNVIAKVLVKDLKKEGLKIYDLSTNKETNYLYLNYDAIKKNNFNPKVKFFLR